MATSTPVLSALASVIAYNADGSVDMDTTLLQVQVAITTELEAARANDAAFEAALDALFDTLTPGKGVPTPFAVRHACAAVANGNVERELELTPLCQAFVARSPRFEAKRGKSGGLFRIG